MRYTQVSQQEHFLRSHRMLYDKLIAFAELQAGPNPLSLDECREMARRWPERYGFMAQWANAREPAK